MFLLTYDGLVPVTAPLINWSFFSGSIMGSRLNSGTLAIILIFEMVVVILTQEPFRSRQNMTPEQQKAYLRDLRLQRRTLIDENAPYLETGVQIAALPEPRAFPLPLNMTSLQFSRILGFTEFIACYQPLLTESALSPGEMLYPTRIKQLATDLCPSMTNNGEEEEEFTTDVEEESALTSTDAGLPKASVQGIRCLSLDRVLRAVSEQHMSAAAYRCLTRPMGSLLRLLFFSEQFSVRYRIFNDCESFVCDHQLPVMVLIS